MNRVMTMFLAVVFLAGCGHKDPKIYAQDGPVADGDRLIEPSLGDAKNLMPPLVDEVGGGDIDALVFNGLLRYDPNFNLEGCLAQKWAVSKNGKVITYYLRKGVKFHDGAPFTADDVLFTYKVYSDPTVNTPFGSNYKDIASVDKLDDYTVRVTYKQPFAPALSTTFDNILPKHLLEGKDINKCDFNRHPIGTGPYKFVDWKTDQKITLEANPDYWEGAPHIKKFVMRVIPNQATEFLELLNGGVDALGAWLHGGLTPEQYSRQIDTPKCKDYYNVYRYDDLAYTYIGWNELNPLFKDKKVRQALTLALDRDAIIKNVIYGDGHVSTGPFPLHSWANNPQVKPFPYDPKKALALLAAAGWHKGKDGLLTRGGKPFKFTLMTNQGNVSRERIATIVQQQYAQMGIQVDVQIVEWTTFLSQYVNPKKFDAVILGWTLSPEPDCYPIFHSSQTAEHQYNFVSYKNKTVDALLVEGRRTLDPKKRRLIYQRLHQVLYDDQPYTFLYVPDAMPAIHKRFKGYEVNDNGIATHPQLWYVPAAQQKYQP
ncbi:MAG TPA: peptide-binding protein [bacterium]|nr:peptide-binding protein [bacterium]